jgi:hypothetical protein
MMLTRKSMKNLALAIGLGAALTASAIAPTMAQSLATNGGNYYYEPEDNGSVWANYPGYDDSEAGAYASADRPERSYATAPYARAQTHYYEGDDNGSVWSYYPGYRPLR